MSGDDPTNAVIASHNLSVGRQAYRPSVRTAIALSTVKYSESASGLDLEDESRKRYRPTARFFGRDGPPACSDVSTGVAQTPGV